MSLNNIVSENSAIYNITPCFFFVFLERIIFVSEYYATNVTSLFKVENNDFAKNPDRLLKLVKEVLSALVYLNEHG